MQERVETETLKYTERYAEITGELDVYVPRLSRAEHLLLNGHIAIDYIRQRHFRDGESDGEPVAPYRRLLPGHQEYVDVLPQIWDRTRLGRFSNDQMGLALVRLVTGRRC